MSLAPVPTPASVPGAVPPQNLEAEESVLGAMMISGNAIAAVTEILDASDFYRESHAKIYRAALQLYGKNEPVDAITLTNELEQRGELDEIGGRVRLHELARLVPATANARHYAEIVRETATLRGLILAGGQIAQLGWDREGEPTELVARAEQLVFELGERRAEGELVLFKDALLEAFQTINKLYESGAEVTGLASGFKDLDRITGGFQPANLVIIAARPSMGKSAFALEIANHVAVDHETPCAFFSLEMSKQEVAQRLICSRGKVDAGHIRTGRLTRDDWPRVVQACGQLESAPLYVDDTPALSLLELRARAPDAEAAPAGSRARRRRLPPADDDRPQRGEPRAGGVLDLPRPEGDREGPRPPGRSRSPSSTARPTARTTSGRCSPTCASRARSSRTPTS